jgi:hypothetical protein
VGIMLLGFKGRVHVWRGNVGERIMSIGGK